MFGSEQLKDKRVLVFELNWMGDILFSMPFLRALRERLPWSYISCVVVPRYSEMLAHNRWINDVHVLDDKRGLGAFPEKLAFLMMIAKEKYDIAFFLKPSRTKVVFAKLAGIPTRIGFAGKNSPLTHVVEDVPSELHRADRLLALLGVLGVSRADGNYEYSVTPDSMEKANALLKTVKGGSRSIVVLNPGGNWDAKKWPLESYRMLGEMLLDEYPDIEIAVTGAAKDVSEASRLARALGGRAYSLAGKTSINQLAAIFSMARLVVSADSGPLHLASSVGARTVALFGPTSPDITGPRGRTSSLVVTGRLPRDCVRPCYQVMCEMDRECMATMKPTDVMEACRKTLEKGSVG